jgi:uncharacterized delta-60 repeat protein
MTFASRPSIRTAARLSAAIRHATQPLIEPLEGRRLLSVAIQGSNGIMLQSTGKPVALDYDANNHAVLVRYFANAAARDYSFGTNGEVDTNLDAILDIARGPNDEIVIGGFGTVAVFNADGSPNTAFAPSGALSVAGGAVNAVAAQPDGKVLVALENFPADGNPGVIQRFNANGTIDSSFGNGGAASISLPGFPDIALQDIQAETSGKIAVVGYSSFSGSSNQQPLIVQLTSGGALDPITFTPPVVNGKFNAVAEAPDGGLIAAGKSFDVSNGGVGKSLLARFLPNGQTSFVTSLPGQAAHSFPVLNDVAVNSDNRIVVTGTAGNGGDPQYDASDFYFQRYDLSGNLDATFANAGTGFVSGNGNDSGGYFALAPDNSFYLAGSSVKPAAPQTSMASLFRISASGQFVPQGAFSGAPWNLPARIEAENFDVGGEGFAYHDTTPTNEGGQYRTSEAVDIEKTTDAGGGYDVGWTNSGEWLQYTVHNPGDHFFFQLDARVANYGAGGSFHVTEDGADITGTLAIPDTGGFQNYTDVYRNYISIPAGDHVFRIVFDGQSQYGYSGNVNWIQLNVAPSSPFGGMPSGGLIQMEDFDVGGEGAAYHDTTPQNEGGQYRTSEGVDIEKTTDSGSGYDVGWTHTGEWLNYTANVIIGGLYTFNTRVANVGAGASFHWEVDGRNVTGSIAVPDTGGFQNWTTVSSPMVQLSPGVMVLRLVIDSQSQYGYGGNFNKAELTVNSNGGLPFTGNPVPLPGTVQAENYNTFGEGVAYHDTTPQQNQGGAYRTLEGVDIEALPGASGYAVDWTHAGEWMNYTVNVTTAGTYTLDAHVSNYGVGGAFHVEVDGVNVTGTLAVPDTRSFTTFADVLKGGIVLTAGQHVVRFIWDAESQYGFSGNLDWFRFA